MDSYGLSVELIISRDVKHVLNARHHVPKVKRVVRAVTKLVHIQQTQYFYVDLMFSLLKIRFSRQCKHCRHNPFEVFALVVTV
jgi:hypothetical protein